jgi:hypothetical protein
MKTTSYCFNRRVLICLGLIALHLTVRTMSAGAITGFDLVLTENSSSSLSLSYNGPSGSSGFTVTPASADHWTISINSAELNIAPFLYEWTEPEDANAVNKVSGNPFSISVVSDLGLALDGAALPQSNNTRSALPIGFDIDQSNPIFLTFNDLAQRTESVPDTGSTLGFLALSLGLLLVAARLRSLQAV